MMTQSLIRVAKVGQEGRECVYCGNTTFVPQGKWQKCTSCQAASLKTDFIKPKVMDYDTDISSPKGTLLFASVYLMFIFGVSVFCMDCCAQESVETKITRSTK